MEGKALASAAEESQNEGLVSPRCFRPFTTAPVKQPTTTQADYGKDGEAMNNDDMKKQKKQVIDLNRKPPEYSQDTYDVVPDLNHPSPLKLVIDLNKKPPESSQDTYDVVPDLNNPSPLKLVIDLNKKPPESSQDTYDVVPDLNNPSPLKLVIDLNKKPPESSQYTYDVVPDLNNPPRGKQVTSTKDPDDVPKQQQPITTQAEFKKDGKDDLTQDNHAVIEAQNNENKKKRKAEGESDNVPVKEKKQMIDLNEKPAESSQVYYSTGYWPSKYE